MPRGRGHGPRMSNEKAKDFKGTMKKLMAYLSAYKIGIFFVIVFAIGSTIFNIVGPKILGKATTEIFKGLVRKVSGGAGIDFDKNAHIVSDKCSVFVRTGVYYDRSITEADLSSEKRNLRKNQSSADELF